ncbi:MAG: PDZ domain-containing protein [Acidobacteriota bacterium]
MLQESKAQSKRAASDQARQTNTAQSKPEIRYTVSMPEPWTHLLAVEMRLKWDRAPAAVDLKMPVWTPGSYLVREYARHVQDMAANSSGRELAWSKINKNTWRIETAAAAEAVITYRVYAHELTVRTNDLNDGHAFWNNAALLLFPAGQLDLPSTVTVKPFGKWKVATGLPKVSGSANTFRAPNYDILYDSPFEVSDFRETEFAVRGKPHRMIISGEGNYDIKKIAADTAKIADEAFQIFGELPLDNYLFIVNVRPGATSNGLEHLNSTALQFNALNFNNPKGYTAFLGLVAHEYFHLWNVKRIRPDSLGPFDYEHENYTKLLWFAEGATAYYEGILMRRAGLISDKELLETKATMIEQLQARPGRFETSLEEASMDAWIKYYRQDENSINNQISYYDKGELVNMMLDLAIRSASGGKRSLDDVMRTLYTDFYKKGQNYTPSDLQAAAEKAAGKSLDAFFSKYVRGTAELDLKPLFVSIGLEIKSDDEDAKKAYLGANLAEDNGRLLVRSVPAKTPAYDQGLNSGDQIVAVNGLRASQTFLTTYIGDKKPGDKIVLTVFRYDRLRELPITLGPNTRPDLAFKPIEGLTAEQRTLYREYLESDL